MATAVDYNYMEPSPRHLLFIKLCKQGHTGSEYYKKQRLCQWFSHFRGMMKLGEYENLTDTKERIHLEDSDQCGKTGISE